MDLTTPSSFILTADRLVVGTADDVLDQPAITVSGDRILDVVGRQRDWQPPPGMRVVAAPGATILPGLIDAHVHLAFPALEAGDVARPEERQLLVGAVERAQLAMGAGVTSMRDLGGGRRLVQRVRDLRDDGRWVGPRIRPRVGPSRRRAVTATGSVSLPKARPASTSPSDA